MKGALATVAATCLVVAAVVAASVWMRSDSPEEIAARPGLAWERSLPARTGLTEESRVEPSLGRLASGIAGSRVEVRCWSEDDWQVVSAEWRLLTRQVHWWPAGIAETDSSRAHLGPEVCGPLALFTYGRYAPRGNEQSLELAEALVVFAHEAEHLRDPSASEARVECFAMQRVRGLVRRSGRSRWYANEMAALAYEIAYPRLDRTYRSRECRNGGRLDRRPNSKLWP